MRAIDAVRANDPIALETAARKASKLQAAAALREAAALGRPRLFKGLVRAIGGAKIYVMQALVPAVQNRHLDAMHALILAGAVPNREWRGRTAEGEAARLGSVEMLEKLCWRATISGKLYRSVPDWDSAILAAVPPEDEDLPAAADGYSPLLNAIRGGHEEALAFLIENGVQVNRPTLLGRHPIEMAQELGEKAIVRRLKKAGGTPLDRAALSLIEAARYGFRDLIPGLEEEASADERRFAFEMAAQSGHVDLVHRFADAADERAVQESLGTAARRGHTAVVRALLALGARPNDHGKAVRYTPLHLAASEGRLALVKLLARAGAKVDKASKGDRIPPLHSAILGEHTETALWLIEHGARVDAVEADGTATMELAQDSPIAEDILPALEKAGGQRDQRKALIKALKGKLKKDKRRAWRPEIGGAEGLSHYGGQPRLSAAHPRPQGPEGPMPLLIQIDLSQHPDKKQQRPCLLQVFYQAREARARLVPREGTAIADQGPALPKRVIAGWGRSKSDFPSRGDDPARSGPELSAEEESGLRDLNVAGDKLGGWPDWLQDAALPLCPDCQGRRSVLLYQIEGGRYIPVDLGDAGLGYVFQCPEHPESLSFVTQSY